MTFRLSTAARHAACDAIVDLVDGGASAGSVKVYDGAQPGSVGGAYGNLLATCPCSDPAFGNAGATVTGRADSNTITSDTLADASGTAASFVLMDSNSAVIADGSCGQGSGDLSFDNSVIVANGTVAIQYIRITVPIS